MELALFWPRGGYYSSRNNIGPEGDYYTAPGAHPAFSALLCVQMYQMWRLLGCPATFWLVEMGAGSGLLCHDLLDYSAYLPREFGNSLRYLCLDRSPAPRVETRLPLDVGKRVERITAREVPLRDITGCFLSNELVDSFPVHRVTVRAGALLEIYVTLDKGNLIEVLDQPSTPALQEHLDSLGVSLPEGFRAEINLSLSKWIEVVSSSLQRGFLLTIDYGHLAPDLYSYPRRGGTISSFYRHTRTDDPYTRIGKQDITAQVDFTSLAEVGRGSGLGPLGFSTQREFFHNLGLGSFIGRLPAMGLRQREVDSNRMGMLDIVRPGGMGEFKVLAQGKGVGSPALWGFGPSPEVEPILEELPVPLQTPLHMPLLEGRYPHVGFEWEELWHHGDEARENTGGA